jgi:hypothetical protein
MGNVEGMTVEEPLPSIFADDRFVRGLGVRADSFDALRTGSEELFGADFGAVVFAINSLSWG